MKTARPLDSMNASPDWMQPSTSPRIGISSCLLGEPVRYDGGHKRDGWIVDVLGPHVTFVALCPEVAVGLGTPRQPVRLVAARGGAPRALGVRDPDLDPSAALRGYGQRMARELDDLCGYLFKRGSPSCGMERVPVHRPRGGPPALGGVGLYAAAFMAARTELPCEEEGRLSDPALQASFLERVWAHWRWRALLAPGGGGLTPARLAEFHDRHRLALLARGVATDRAALDRMVEQAHAGGLRDLPARAAEYGRAFLAHLGRAATRRGHGAVLRHLQGCLAPTLDAAERAELGMALAAYRAGEAPLSGPLALLRHHAPRHSHPEVAGQTYLHPYPAELL